MSETKQLPVAIPKEECFMSKKMLCREVTSKLAKIFNLKYIEKLAFVSVVSALILLISFLFFAPLSLADDTFGGFDAKVCGEKSLSSSMKYIINRDYDIFVSRRGSDVTILSIHGGCIEAYTSEITQILAEQYEWNRYDLKGHIKGTSIPDCYKEEQQKDNFKILHITSINFDDPKVISLVEKHPRSISIHGYRKERDTKPGYQRGTICVGGGNEAQVRKFREYINKSGLALPSLLIPVNARKKNNEDNVCNKLQGTNPENIVNKNGSGKGELQLELSLGMRQDLANLDDVKFNNLRDVVYGAVAQAMAD